MIEEVTREELLERRRKLIEEFLGENVKEEEVYQKILDKGLDGTFFEDMLRGYDFLLDD